MFLNKSLYLATGEKTIIDKYPAAACRENTALILQIVFRLAGKQWHLTIFILKPAAFTEVEE